MQSAIMTRARASSAAANLTYNTRANAAKVTQFQEALIMARKRKGDDEVEKLRQTNAKRANVRTVEQRNGSKREGLTEKTVDVNKVRNTDAVVYSSQSNVPHATNKANNKVSRAKPLAAMFPPDHPQMTRTMQESNGMVHVHASNQPEVPHAMDTSNAKVSRAKPLAAIYPTSQPEVTHAMNNNIEVSNGKPFPYTYPSTPPEVPRRVVTPQPSNVVHTSTQPEVPRSTSWSNRVVNPQPSNAVHTSSQPDQVLRATRMSNCVVNPQPSNVVHNSTQPEVLRATRMSNRAFNPQPSNPIHTSSTQPEVPRSTSRSNRGVNPQTPLATVYSQQLANKAPNYQQKPNNNVGVNVGANNLNQNSRALVVYAHVKVVPLAIVPAPQIDYYADVGHQIEQQYHDRVMTRARAAEAAAAAEYVARVREMLSARVTKRMAAAAAAAYATYEARASQMQRFI